MPKSLSVKVKSATKWSAITEILAKLVSPLTSILLARLLVPEAFGIVATMTMVISFADIFADAGFNKYIIQHEFISNEERVQCTNVAFWSNLFVSLLLCVVISVYSSKITNIVGCPDCELGLIVASMSIPLSAFSSIQSSLYKRDFDFKTLFRARIISVLVPLLITTPLAFILRSYWALILGNIIRNLINATYLTFKSPWKPTIYYSFTQLKQMFSFSVWNMFEAVSIWLTSYADIFIVGTILNQYYLGLYRTSMATVGGIIGVITAATTPVLFSSLSRLQNNREEFNEMFFKTQKIVSILIVPLGFGIFLFSDIVTKIMLGDQWMEAVGFIGLWGVMSTVTILFSHYASEVYRSKGRPSLSFLSQWLHIIVLIPVVYFFAERGFDQLYVARSFVRIESVIVDCVILFLCFNISSITVLKNVAPAFISSTIMLFFGICLRMITSSFFWSLFFIMICTCVYFIIIMTFKEERRIILNIKKFIIGRFLS